MTAVASGFKLSDVVCGEQTGLIMRSLALQFINKKPDQTAQIFGQLSLVAAQVALGLHGVSQAVQPSWCKFSSLEFGFFLFLRMKKRKKKSNVYMYFL